MADRPTRHPEPEIIPPGVPLPSGARVWVASETRGAHQVYVRPIGPVGLALLTLAGGAVAALLIIFLLGAAIFGLAVIGALTLIGVVAGLLRGPTRPLR
jgi:predicted lipid-binding transport protein (Tim44 family)